MVSPPAIGQLHCGNKSTGNKIMSYLKGTSEHTHTHMHTNGFNNLHSGSLHTHAHWIKVKLSIFECFLY